jgi:hypothetical protein
LVISQALSVASQAGLELFSEDYADTDDSTKESPPKDAKQAADSLGGKL